MKHFKKVSFSSTTTREVEMGFSLQVRLLTGGQIIERDCEVNVQYSCPRDEPEPIVDIPVWLNDLIGSTTGRIIKSVSDVGPLDVPSDAYINVAKLTETYISETIYRIMSNMMPNLTLKLSIAWYYN